MSHLSFCVADVSEEQIQLLKEKLLSTPCRNQGYVLEGFPSTSEQAEKLFGGEKSTCSLTCAYIELIEFFYIYIFTTKTLEYFVGSIVPEITSAVFGCMYLPAEHI